MKLPKIAIFASGRGSNASAIHQYALSSQRFEVACILSNRKNAGILDYAEKHGIPTLVFTKKEVNESEKVLDFLIHAEIDLVVLAGFLLLVPEYLVEAYPRALINIHPALLPKYGGKGMYGKHVHEAVKKNKEVESGITIHYVNQNYDEGSIILQTKCRLSSSDNASDIATAVLKLEHTFYSPVIASLAESLD